MIRVRPLALYILLVVLSPACTSGEYADQTETSESSETTARESKMKDPKNSGKSDVEPDDSTPATSKQTPKVDKPQLSPKKPASALTDPSQANARAPEQFRVRFKTTAGDFVILVKREWSPLGADRFYNLVKIDFFKDVSFFRVIQGFVAQFGISGNPSVNRAWESFRFKDDPVKESNLRGSLSFATAGSNTRTTQFFINFKDNAPLDTMGFSPIGKVVEGMEVVDSLYSGYGEGAPRGKGPNQGTLKSQGNTYLKDNFPKLDYIKEVTILK